MKFGVYPVSLSPFFLLPLLKKVIFWVLFLILWVCLLMFLLPLTLGSLNSVCRFSSPVFICPVPPPTPRSTYSSKKGIFWKFFLFWSWSLVCEMVLNVPFVDLNFLFQLRPPPHAQKCNALIYFSYFSSCASSNSPLKWTGKFENFWTKYFFHQFKPEDEEGGLKLTSIQFFFSIEKI